MHNLIYCGFIILMNSIDGLLRFDISYCHYETIIFTIWKDINNHTWL